MNEVIGNMLAWIFLGIVSLFMSFPLFGSNIVEYGMLALLFAALSFLAAFAEYKRSKRLAAEKLQAKSSKAE